MRWEKEHQEEMRASEGFVRFFASVPDPIVAVADKACSLEARIAWVLLGTAISQELPLILVSKVLEELFRDFPHERLWTFPLPEESKIAAAVRRGKGSYAWELEEQVPGIFWSVGNFVRRRSPLAGWFSSTSYKGICRDLGEIFFMGKGAYRPKAILAISRLAEPFPRGLNVIHNEINPPIPFAFGIRKWMGFIGPGKELRFSEMDEQKKRHLGETLCKTLYKEDPLIASHAFQFFLEKGENSYICSEHTENCSRCPLALFCTKSKGDGCV